MKKKKVKFIYKLLFLVPIVMIVSIIGELILQSLDTEKNVKKITNGKYSIEIFSNIPIDIPNNYIVTYRFSLMNIKQNKSIVSNIQKYKVIEEKKLIYLIGEDEPIDLNNPKFKYYILNYDTDECNSYLILEDMEKSDRIIFENESEFQIPNDNS